VYKTENNFKNLYISQENLNVVEPLYRKHSGYTTRKCRLFDNTSLPYSRLPKFLEFNFAERKLSLWR
jgi:hypothetical protein